MIVAMILNWISILSVMLPSFRVNIYTSLDEFSVLDFLLISIHASLGRLTETLGIVSILKKFGNVRMWIRLTLAVWVIAFILGMMFYLRCYVP